MSFRTAYNALATPFVLGKLALRGRRRDRAAALTHGVEGPRYCERIWVRLDEVREESLTRGAKTAVVMGGDWYKNARPLTDNPKIAYCLRHWRDGLTWDETGAIDYTMGQISDNVVYDHLTTKAQVLRRFATLDRIFEQVRRENRIRPVREYRFLRYREQGGLMFHIGPDGRPMFAGGGHHRVGMALALGLREVPAMVLLAHPNGLWALPRLRQPVGTEAAPLIQES
ncbi:hypothetical protein SAMN04490244_11090 [Tranquillimonas rosea]|uniref:Uncharacterized protein n=1 Tax=Tranquillimonas rosea TaxID=641238 RepID=A0A1H9WEM9_9RHOB|nr:hypothetical protein [Tranquillimonas rosea]SES31903.1 hypothetical protein SAMN04490244_11090 [Tranquillimonas rosea]